MALIARASPGSRMPDAVRSAAQAVEDDTASCMICDAAFRIRHANPRAQGEVHAKIGASLATLLRPRIAHPTAILHRLATQIEVGGHATEDFLVGNGALRIIGRKIDATFTLWRILPVSEACGSEVGVPVLTTGRRGAVLAMNEAAHRLFGRRLRDLGELGLGDEARTGTAFFLDTPLGSQRLELRCFEAGQGRTEVALLPASASGGDPILEGLPIALLRVTPEGVVSTANREARQLLKLEDGEDARLGQLLEGLGRPISEWLADAASGRGLGRPEFLRLSRSPEETIVQVALTRGAPDEVIAVLTDATELKTLEAQFVQSQKMQAIGQLAGGIAHDFNNLLTAISGHCDLLLLRHSRGDQDYDDVVQINQNANRAAALVGQLLAFSRKQSMKAEIIDLRETLADLTHLLNRLVGERVTLELRYEPALPPIRADRRQLEQVMMNLVVNARDAMPEGGRILVETEFLRLREPMLRDRARVEPGDYIVVKVSDTGIGIPPENVRKVFEPFYTTKRSGEGTGLGLSTVYGIVKQTGGFVFLDSEVGKGTTFRLMFPAHTGPVPARAKDPDKPVLRKPSDAALGGVVLLVEDEAPVRAFAVRGLRLKGLTVIEADCGERALEILSDPGTRIDLAVSDMIMPGLDGPSWVREARKDRPDMPVVFMSGYAADALEASAADIDGAQFLQKPFSLNALAETVRQNLALAKEHRERAATTV
ncbi:hybrid sensor histidine kinase/response regulator [Roseivivax halodurans]|nr:ATP-binding protein [Roseivivax halodurans]